MLPDRTEILLAVAHLSSKLLTITTRKGFIEVDSEQKFAEELKKIFATEGTKRVISALISQSQA